MVEAPPANTGRPTAPAARYMSIAAPACFHGSISAASITTNVCKVIGTGVPGIGTAPAAEAAHMSTANSVGLSTDPRVPLVAVFSVVLSVSIALRTIILLEFDCITVDESTIVDGRNDGNRKSDENAWFVNLCPQS